VFLHVTDREKFEPVLTGIALTKILFEMYREEFEWKDTPYEYEYDRNPYDVIHGSTKIREMIEAEKSLEEIKQFWQNDVRQFQESREKYLLY
jgi:uncharacterized protein YbbC (DUF1343 family)